MATERNDERTGIQAGKPVPAWERPGCFRLDGEPHRGDLLWWLAALSFAFTTFAVTPCWGWIPGLVGIAPCFTIRQMARRDLAKMRTGLIDPHGRTTTANAAFLANLGLCFSIAGTLIWGPLFLLAFFLLPD